MPDVDQDATAAHPDRRTVIRGAGVMGVAVVGATALAACGGDSGTSASGAAASGSANNTSSAAASTTSGGSDGGAGIAKADVPVGGGTIIAATKTVVTQPKAGEFKAFSSICTHMGCPVAKVTQSTIDCSCHGSQYDIATGAVTRGPATKPLPPKTVTVKGDELIVT
jgi:Rieske Fe-S protein